MNIFDRALNILTKPAEEWPIIGAETESNVRSMTAYLLLLALIPAVASFIGWGLIGGKVLFLRIADVGVGLRLAASQYISIIAGAYLTAWIYYMLAPNFGTDKNFDKAFRLTAYSYTPVCVGGIFYIYSGISFLAGLASIYSLVLLYMGIGPVMQPPQEKRTGYFVVGLIVMIVVSVILNVVFGSIFHVRELIY